MKKKICGLIFIIGFALLIGIIGGVDMGEPLRNTIWCFPIMLVMWTVGEVGGLFDEV